MADDPSLHDLLDSNLQSVVDKRLTANEGVLMALAGAHGEGLVATDKRVFILREQMPIVAGETEVDCFDYPYDQILTVRVDGAVGGGHIKLILITPPLDEKEVTLYFPVYDLAKFDTAAARIRMLCEQTRSLPVVSPMSASLTPTPILACQSCSAMVDSSWLFCSQCGAALGPMCAYCGSAVPASAKHCPHCGTIAGSPLALACADCAGPMSPRFKFCPACGARALGRCDRCGERILPAWKSCPGCGWPAGSETGQK